MRLQFEKTILSSWNALNIYIFLNFTKNCENTYFIMFFVVFSTDNVVLRCFFASCHVWFKYSVKCSDTAKGLKKCVHTIKEKKEDLARMSTDIQQGEGNWPKCQLTVNRGRGDWSMCQLTVSMGTKVLACCQRGPWLSKHMMQSIWFWLILWFPLANDYYVCDVDSLNKKVWCNYINCCDVVNKVSSY